MKRGWGRSVNAGMKESPNQVRVKSVQREERTSTEGKSSEASNPLAKLRRRKDRIHEKKTEQGKRG